MMQNVPAPCRLCPVDLPGAKKSRGLGSLSARAGGERVSLPLARVEIAARVADRVADVTVAETFRNELAECLEATYIFPLSGGAAVREFELRVGSRTIRGIVQERGEARASYAKALDEGKRAALLEQEREGVFTVQVGNLPPGEEVTVHLRYSERLPFFEDGATELRLPLVVAPRYIRGEPVEREPVGDGTEPDTDAVPDASRITPPRLAPGFDPKVGLSIEVEIARPGADEIADLACSQHATRTALGQDRIRVALAREGEPLDRDFVLRWRLAGETVRPALLWHRPPEEGAYGLLSLVPPRREGFLGLARDVVFLLDRSGSMGGPKMAQAARACAILLATLGPRDRFAILAFDDVVEEFDGGRFAPADEGGIERGERFLRGIEARGGTELERALEAAISAIRARPSTEGTRSPVIVLLTDGQVGDEAGCLKRVQADLGDARVFAVGIDTAVNDAFLSRIAVAGGGTAAFVEPGARLEAALRAVAREIGEPLVTDLAIEDVDAGLDRDSIAPASVPDLFAGRAATILFRARSPGRVRVTGRYADGARFEATVEPGEVDLPAIAHLWAKGRVTDLEDRFRTEPQSQAAVKKEIIELATRHTLLTRFTAFVVVDEAEIVNKSGKRRKMIQPVAMPAGWEMAQAAPPPSAKVTGASLLCGGAPPPAYFGAAIPHAGPAAPFFAPAAPPPPPCSPPAPMAMAAPPPAPAMPAPPRYGSPARGGKGGLGGIGGSLASMGAGLAGLFGGRGGRAKEMADSVREPGPNPALEGEGRAIEKALKELADAFASARAEIDSGRMPDATELERTRQALVAALGASSLGLEMPLLQRFVRKDALELIAALRSNGAGAAALRPYFERHAKAFEAARAEAAPRLRAAATGYGAGSAFWEKTV